MPRRITALTNIRPMYKFEVGGVQFRNTITIIKQVSNIIYEQYK